MQKSNHQESGFAQGASLKVVLGHLCSLQELPQQGCPTLRSVVILSGEGLVVSQASKSSVLSSALEHPLVGRSSLLKTPTAALPFLKITMGLSSSKFVLGKLSVLVSTGEHSRERKYL